jgi:putative membrane protein
MFRALKWTIGVSILNGLLLLVLSWIVPGFDLSGFGAALLMALIGVVAGAFIWPFVYWLSSRFHPIVFPILSFVLTGFSILLIVAIMDRIDSDLVQLDSTWTAILVAMGLTAANTVMAAVFSLDDQRTYDRFVTSHIRRTAGKVPHTDVPGVIFVEIDGLSEPVLRTAIAGG